MDNEKNPYRDWEKEGFYYALVNSYIPMYDWFINKIYTIMS